MKYLDKILIFLIAIFIATGVSYNIYKQNSVDKTKIPTKLETNSRFQRWLSNLKEKGLDLDADSFRFKEENNIFNTIWTSTESIDNEVSRKTYEQNMKDLEVFKQTEKSPNEEEIVNFAPTERFGFTSNQVFFYGLREDRILKTKIAECQPISGCNFHRASFLDNHVFFVMELSPKDYDKNNPKVCSPDDLCNYTFKVHLVDLINNSRSVYESSVLSDTYNNLLKKL